MTSHVLAPNNALAVPKVTSESQASYPIAYGRDRFPNLVEVKYEIVNSEIVAQINDRTAPAHNQDCCVLLQILLQCVESVIVSFHLSQEGWRTPIRPIRQPCRQVDWVVKPIGSVQV